MATTYTKEELVNFGYTEQQADSIVNESVPSDDVGTETSTTNSYFNFQGLGSFWFEKESPANVDSPPKYPYVKQIQTKSGHSVELDDTPGKERIRVQHRMESFIEMHEDGSVVHKIVGDGYEIVAKGKNVSISGNYNLTIEGDSNITINGNARQYVKGNYDVVVDGNYTQVVKGDIDVMADGDLAFSANPVFGGTVNMNTGGSLVLDCDLTISGQLIADKISSVTRIDAGTGVYAGPLGFVSVLGGLSIGIPIAVPGVIYSQAAIITPGIVAGNLGTFSIMCAGLMTDFINVPIFDIHTHPAPRGWTGIPVPPMI